MVDGYMDVYSLVLIFVEVVMGIVFFVVDIIVVMFMGCIDKLMFVLVELG